MPDYDLSNVGTVRLTVYGGVIDPAYSRLLIRQTGLPLADVLVLDRVQKKLPIPEGAVTRLKRLKLIERRKPNYHVSATVAADKRSQRTRYAANLWSVKANIRSAKLFVERRRSTSARKEAKKCKANISFAASVFLYVGIFRKRSRKPMFPGFSALARWLLLCASG